MELIWIVLFVVLVLSMFVPSRSNNIDSTLPHSSDDRDDYDDFDA